MEVSWYTKILSKITVVTPSMITFFVYQPSTVLHLRSVFRDGIKLSYNVTSLLQMAQAIESVRKYLKIDETLDS